MKRFFLPLLVLLLAGPAVRAQQPTPPAVYSGPAVIVLANRNVPEGLELGRYYLAQRGLPADWLCELDLPEGETISRADYERKLRDPLLAYLRGKGLVKQVRRDPKNVAKHDSGWTTVEVNVRYLVPVYGVPLRIDDTQPWPLEKLAELTNHGAQRDEAAVDSELCLTLLDGYELKGRMANPHYNQLRWTASDEGPHLLLVSRLDGPSPLGVRRMIDHALQAERRGLHGRVYIDQRAARDDDYLLGDVWLEEAALRFQREGYDVLIERTDAVFGDRYPMDDAAVYLGWYTDHATGPFARAGFSFRPGAIAYHNHSGNAVTLRSRTEHWAGALLGAGATASMGAVAEPFLGYTPHLPILVDRLCRGLAWADSVYLSLTALSWQATVIGDPLYRPFAVPLQEQIRLMEAEDEAGADWAHLRRINLLLREGRLNVAMRLCRERLRARESALLREKLAELYALNELYPEAAENYDRALADTDRPEAAARIAVRYASLLRATQQASAANGMIARLRERWPNNVFIEAVAPLAEAATAGVPAP